MSAAGGSTFTGRDVLAATGAELARGSADVELAGVSTDTRTLRAGELYVALSGPNFDGNRFAPKALEAGAGALLLKRPDEPGPAAAAGPPLFLHDDPRRALGDLAAWHRSRLACPVVGITGSCGKTTTKNLLMELLREHRLIVGSPSSFNNDVGVPLTLFGADRDTEVLICEIGTNQPGEIAHLCRIARPTAGIVTNVGRAHLEGLGSVEGVAREKADLLACLPSDGFAVVNLDGPHADLLRASTSARVISTSVEGEGELNATDVWFHAGGTTFRLEGHEVTSPLLGTHNVHNLLCALAACRGLGLSLEEVLPSVSRVSAGGQRMERVDLGDIALFDDTWNANPDSVAAGVRVLAGIHGHTRRVLVLGDMLELGDAAPELHHALGLEAAQCGIDLAIFVGDLARASAAGALEGGLAAERVVHVRDAAQAIDVVPGLLAEGDVVLVKASRRVGLEALVRHLTTARRGRRCS